MPLLQDGTSRFGRIPSMDIISSHATTTTKSLLSARLAHRMAYISSWNASLVFDGTCQANLAQLFQKAKRLPSLRLNFMMRLHFASAKTMECTFETQSTRISSTTRGSALAHPRTSSSTTVFIECISSRTRIQSTLR